jgi:hypothetical protein
MTRNDREGDYFALISKGLEARTLEHSTDLGLAHAEANRSFMEKTVKQLIGAEKGRDVLVVSGGPSLHRRQSIERIKPVADRFVVVAADGTMGHCLRAGITPDYVLSADPDRTRIVRWFGDDNLTEEKLSDDYFRRQDLDEHFNRDEIAKNEDQIRLVNAAGPGIKAVLSTGACEGVRRRCFNSGMDVYWWNPIYDDVSDPASLTRQLFESNKVPCMNTGGNVGTAATIFAARILGAARVVMLGMDFAYYGDTPYERTQYYDQFREFMPEEEISHAFKHIHNPVIGGDYFTDPAYYWYREAFFEFAESMGGCELINATEGGILFGENITCRTVDDVIEFMTSEGTDK